jgi:hypothetical protein
MEACEECVGWARRQGADSRSSRGNGRPAGDAVLPLVGVFGEAALLYAVTGHSAESADVRQYAALAVELGAPRLGRACKTGGFQETKLNYFNDLQKFRRQLIRLSIRAGTGIEPFKTKAYTGGREIAFGGLVPIRSRWPRNLALSEVDDADPFRNSDPDLHQQFDNALVDKPPRAPPLPVGIGTRQLA